MPFARHVVMIKALPKLLRRINLILIVPPKFLFHGSAPVFQRLLQRCGPAPVRPVSARRSFCASAGVTLAAASNAKNVFLIEIVSLVTSGLSMALCGYVLYDIITLQVERYVRTSSFKPYNNRGASIADKSSNHWRGPRDCCWALLHTYGIDNVILERQTRTMCSARIAPGPA